jgi:hypothetical protein
MPLIMGVYLQPVERTAQELAKHGMDLYRTIQVSDSYHGV